MQAASGKYVHLYPSSRLPDRVISADDLFDAFAADYLGDLDFEDLPGRNPAYRKQKN